MKFGDSPLLGSGATASQSSVSDKGTIGQTDVLSGNAPYIFGKPHDPSAVGSLFVTVADSSTRELHRMLARVSRSIWGSGTHSYTLALQFEYQ